MAIPFEGSGLRRDPATDRIRISRAIEAGRYHVTGGISCSRTMDSFPDDKAMPVLTAPDPAVRWIRSREVERGEIKANPLTGNT